MFRYIFCLKLARKNSHFENIHRQNKFRKQNRYYHLKKDKNSVWTMIFENKFSIRFGLNLRSEEKSVWRIKTMVIKFTSYFPSWGRDPRIRRGKGSDGRREPRRGPGFEQSDVRTSVCRTCRCAIRSTWSVPLEIPPSPGAASCDTTAF